MAEYSSPNAQYVDAVLRREENPFATVEALGEHIGMLWGILAKTGVEVWEQDEKGHKQRPKGKPGEAVYHLRAVDNYQQKLTNAMGALMPDLSKADEADDEAFARIETELIALRDRHEQRWLEFMATFKNTSR